MNSSNSSQANNKSNSSSAQRLARALAEMENQGSVSDNQSAHLPQIEQAANSQATSIFNADGSPAANQIPSNESRQQLTPQQLEQLKQEQQRKQRNQEQHDKINPVNQTEIFAAQELQVKAKIREIRQELQQLAQEVTQFNQEVDVALQQEVVNPGQEGKYHFNFLDHLQQYIMMLRQRVSSAHTWMQVMQSKQRKRQRGLNFGQNAAKAAHDMFHHERSSAYGA